MRFGFLLAIVALSGCDYMDPNSEPKYGETGLPKNCRAYVQVAIDGFRNGTYTATQSMDGLERNCGKSGISWGR